MNDSALWEHVPEPSCFDADVPTRIGNDKYNGKQATKKAKKPMRKSPPAMGTKTKTKLVQKVLYFDPNSPDDKAMLDQWDKMSKGHKGASRAFIDCAAIGIAVSEPETGLVFLETYHKGFIDKIRVKSTKALQQQVDAQSRQIDILMGEILSLREELDLTRNRQHVIISQVDKILPTITIMDGYIANAKLKATNKEKELADGK